MANKPHPWRDALFFLHVEELRLKHHCSVSKVLHSISPERGGHAPIDDHEIEERSKRIDLQRRSIPAMNASYARGRRAVADPGFKWPITSTSPEESQPKKRVGRVPDAVNNYIMYDAVHEALQMTPKPSLRQAFRIAQRELRAYDPAMKLSIGRIRYAYEVWLKKKSSLSR